MTDEERVAKYAEFKKIWTFKAVVGDPSKVSEDSSFDFNCVVVVERNTWLGYHIEGSDHFFKIWNGTKGFTFEKKDPKIYVQGPLRGITENGEFNHEDFRKRYMDYFRRGLALHGFEEEVGASAHEVAVWLSEPYAFPKF